MASKTVEALRGGGDDSLLVSSIQKLEEIERKKDKQGIVQEDTAHQQAPALYGQPATYYRGQCTYFFRIFNLEVQTKGHGPLSNTIFTQDFYLGHLGFRGWYGPAAESDSWKYRDIGIYLCFFGSNGPSNVPVRVRMSVITSKDTEDILLREHRGVIDMSSKESMDFWVKEGISVTMKDKDLYNNGADWYPHRVIRYDIALE